MIKIDKDVPMPDKIARGPGGGHLIAVIREMEPGDSAFFQTQKEARAFHSSGRRNKIPMMTRKVGTGFRVWRIRDDGSNE